MSIEFFMIFHIVFLKKNLINNYLLLFLLLLLQVPCFAPYWLLPKKYKCLRLFTVAN